MRAVVGRCTAT
ncbi:hypothetical protein LINPERPRIM_LOCUS1021 [Linum perenne]